jgi:dihydropteroate synthase
MSPPTAGGAGRGLVGLLRASPGVPRVMGVLNATPDSFSDGGRYPSVDAAVAAAADMVAAGADILDVGGESTRPGSLPVDPAEQIDRVVPVIQGIVAAGLPVVVSVDTTRAAVAAAALAAGATVVNDVSAGRDDPALLPVVAAAGADLILMHMRGTPATMQLDPSYADVVAEVCRFLADRVAAALAAGVDPGRVLVDPGIGFGKKLEHNLLLMRGLPRLVGLGWPVVVGTSRKGFIGQVTGEPVGDRAFGTAATVAWAVAAGAAIVRVHDVGPMRRVAAMTHAIRTAGDG